MLEEEINLVFFAVLDSTAGYVDPAYRTVHSLKVEIITESFKLRPSVALQNVLAVIWPLIPTMGQEIIKT